MLYKVLYIILGVMVSVITAYVSIAMVLSNSVIDSWAQGVKDGNDEVFLDWYTKYEQEKLDISLENDTCKINVYNIYLEGKETVPEGNEVNTEANGYLFIISNIDPNVIKYNNSSTYQNDAAVRFYVGESTVDVTYSSYEFYRIEAAQIEVMLNDSSSNNSVLEQFKANGVEDTITKFDKVEFLDAAGNIYATMSNVPANPETDYENWVEGYTVEEREAFNHPKNFFVVYIAVAVVVLLFALGFFLLFFRKKKERLFLSDKPKASTTNTSKPQVKASTVKAEEVVDIIDEDKIEDDDVDENALL